ncbi:MAG: phosphate ABC transporter substrate-binding protein [Usitatibacter sp.]
MTRRTLLVALVCLMAGLDAAASAGEVVAIVSSKSPVMSLKVNQVADIFLGKTSRFPDGSEAVPIDQVEDSPAREHFYAAFTGKSAAQVKAHWSKIIFTGRGQPPRQVANGAEARKAVAANPNAIAYIDASLVDDSVRVLALAK